MLMTAHRSIPAALIEEVGQELMRRAAIDIPQDYRDGIRVMLNAEENELSRFVLQAMLDNWEVAEQDRRAMCADTGLPRYYVKCGNDASVEGGFVALERALRRATAKATHDIPLRPNRVHPLTRVDHNNNVGILAPEIEYSFEPGGDWIDITTVHKGGLFGTDYRMLFPGDGIDGVTRRAAAFDNRIREPGCGGAGRVHGRAPGEMRDQGPDCLSPPSRPAPSRPRSASEAPQAAGVQH